MVAPETWGWAGDADLASWGRAIAIAAIAMAIGAYLAASFTPASIAIGDIDVADPTYRAGDPRWAVPLALTALAVLAACGAVLVSSSVS